MLEEEIDKPDREFLKRAYLRNEQLTDRVLHYLWNHGAECVGQISIDLVISSERVYKTMQNLETRGLVIQAPYRNRPRNTLDCKREKRWHLAPQ